MKLQELLGTLYRHHYITPKFYRTRERKKFKGGKKWVSPRLA
jgi:hypothetical protein